MRKLNLNIEEDLLLVPENHDGSWPVCEHKVGNIAAFKENPILINKIE